MTWPPTAAEFYLELNGRERPAFQGDVYRDVLFTKAKGGDTPTSDPKPVEETRTVATLSHPCDMVTDDGVTLRRCQAIVLVRDGSRDHVPENWGGSYHVCPLPDLMGDGRLWVADFQLVSNVDRSFLSPARRVRCLSELGWAVFRQRFALAATRGEIELDHLTQLGSTTWAESMMEMEWLAAGRDQASLQEWLNSPDEEQCAGFDARRDVVKEHDGVDRIWALLRSTIGGGPAG